MSGFAVVTVIHNSEAELERLLSSINRFLNPAPQVVVVDSGSSDEGVAVARRHGAEVVELDDNRGFGAGCNAGIDRVRAPVTALLNPDIELLDDSLWRLVDEAGAVDALIAPRLLNPDGSVQDTAHPRPGTVEALVPAALPRPLLPGPVRRRYEPWRDSVPRRVGWAIAAALVARTDTLRRLGPFNPTAFLFYEDLDLCLRAADIGIPTLLRPGVELRHVGGASVGRSPGRGEPAAEGRAPPRGDGRPGPRGTRARRRDSGADVRAAVRGAEAGRARRRLRPGAAARTALSAPHASLTPDSWRE